MAFPKLQTLLRGGFSLERLWAALARRLTAIPHFLAYLAKAGPGSTNSKEIRAYLNRHSGSRAFIVGNGPSLAKTALDPLRDEFAFGLNRIYLLFEDDDFRPSYYVCMNDLVLKQSRDEILGLDMPRFLNWRQRGLFQGREGETVFLRESYRPHFSTDLTSGVWGGSTVTFVALQIAYWMGFEEVILLGVDHHYTAQGAPHSTEVAEGPDPDHFDPRYFSAGDRWHLPDLHTAEMAYRMARQAFEGDGRRILDATLGGKLHVFPKVEYDSLF